MSLLRAFINVPAVGLLVATVLLTGCNLAPPPKKVKSKPKVQVPVEKATTVQPPNGWPAQVPMYPNSEMVSFTGGSPAGGEMYLKTEDTADQVFRWYFEQLEAKKWGIHGPTLDVAQNIAIIDANLGQLKLYLEARPLEDDTGKFSGTTVRLSSNGLSP